ncbi:hypothetical protein GCM10028812_10480 [Ancylobacter sonchi]
MGGRRERHIERAELDARGSDGGSHGGDRGGSHHAGGAIRGVSDTAPAIPDRAGRIMAEAVQPRAGKASDRQRRGKSTQQITGAVARCSVFPTHSTPSNPR